MASSSLPPVTPIGIQDAERFATVVSAAFAGDALNRSSILDAQSLSIDTHISIERRAKYFLPSITSKAEIGAILVRKFFLISTLAISSKRQLLFRSMSTFYVFTSPQVVTLYLVYTIQF